MRATIQVLSNDEAQALFGIADRHARLLRSAYDVSITVRNGELAIEGAEENVAAAAKAAEEILKRFRASGHVDEHDVDLVVKGGGAGGPPEPPPFPTASRSSAAGRAAPSSRARPASTRT